MLISTVTVDIKLTFCCGTCDVSTLVGMTRHNIYIYSYVKSTKRLLINVQFKLAAFLLLNIFCKVAR